MPTSDEHSLDRPPPAAVPQRSLGSYSSQALRALDGVLVHVALNGETVGFYFGANEQAAAEAIAEHLSEVPISDEGASA